MENVYLQTSQNINLEQSVASIGERIVAQFIDYLLFGTYALVVSIFYMSLADMARMDSPVIPILLALPILFYDLVCEIFFNGQNAGKRVMKLKVVTADGSQPGFVAYFIRWMFRILDTTVSFGSIATLTIIFNGKGCRLGDLAAGTRVIRLKPLLDQEFTTAFQLPHNYSPVFKESENLTDKDFAILREIFEFRMQNGYTSSVIDLMENARSKYAQKLNINSGLSTKDFLNALELDYIYYNSQKHNS